MTSDPWAEFEDLKSELPGVPRTGPDVWKGVRPAILKQHQREVAEAERNGYRRAINEINAKLRREGSSLWVQGTR